MYIDPVALALLPFLRKGKRWKKDPVTGCMVMLGLLALVGATVMACVTVAF